MLYNDIPSKIIGIYKINFPNNKIYIGRAKDIKHRIWEHYCKKDNTTCQKALYKYYNAYTEIDIDILEQFSEYNHTVICEQEKYWIKQYNSFLNKDIGYNQTSGGDGADCGVDNHQACFSQNELEIIYQLLKQGKSNREIANLFKVYPDTIGNINQGHTYFNPEMQYPIRQINECRIGLNNHQAKTKEAYEQIIYFLQNTTLSNQSISEKTGISTNVISEINQGKHFICQDFYIDYPIRKTNRRSKKLTEDEILNIQNDLKNTKISKIQLAKKYQCSRDTIADINSGKTHYNKNMKYPIRL